MVEALPKAFPHAVETTNNDDHLPLHVKLVWDVEVVVVLLLPFPSFECFDCLKDRFPEHLNTFLEQMLNETVLHSTQSLRVVLLLSSGLFRLSRQQRSTDTRVSSKADERATEMLQLACVVARYLCPFYHSLLEDRKYVDL